ncbi:MAG: hypothetical protein JSW04_08400 [Desulfobacterales bacterium]|nr:MAG: hypothetical protein JSW04_08400 [Desulfobacterales bacterium]
MKTVFRLAERFFEVSFCIIQNKSLPLVLLVVLGVGGLVISIGFSLTPKNAGITETPVEVVEIVHQGKKLWSVPKAVIGRQSGKLSPYVLRIKGLRAEQLNVEVVAETDGSAEVRSDDLKPVDLLVLDPGKVQPGLAIAPINGIDDERLVQLTLEAGSAAVMAEDLEESVRFISPNYHDSLGFDFNLIRRLIERAYEEFDQPLIELAGSQVSQIEGFQAVVQTQMKLTAIYNNRRNYLIGNRIEPNIIRLLMVKSANGWKVSQVKGLRPLGFGESFLKILGDQIGLPLTASEHVQKRQTCMPCRRKMQERFGN